jgi:hypothetical protein
MALHESHLMLFRNRPALAAHLIRDALGVPLPEFREARVKSADLTEVQPAEYRADLVIQLWSDRPVYGIIVEVQLSVDERKRCRSGRRSLLCAVCAWPVGGARDRRRSDRA